MKSHFFQFETLRIVIYNPLEGSPLVKLNSLRWSSVKSKSNYRNFRDSAKIHFFLCPTELSLCNKLGFPIGIPLRAIARYCAQLRGIARNACFHVRHFIARNCAIIANRKAITFLRNCFASKNICSEEKNQKKDLPAIQSSVIYWSIILNVTNMRNMRNITPLPFPNKMSSCAPDYCLP